MRKIGILNPLLPIICLFLLYYFNFFVKAIISKGLQNDVGTYFLVLFLFVFIFLLPVITLMFFKLLFISDTKISIIYLFRLQKKTFLIEDLKSVFTQKIFDPAITPFSFNQTSLYFGNENRVKLSAFEFLNYKSLRKYLERLHSPDKHNPIVADC